MTVVTKAELARRFGVDRAQPTRWAEQGMPVLPDGTVDLDAASEWVVAMIDPGARHAHQVARQGYYGSENAMGRTSRMEAADALVRLGIKFTADKVPALIARLVLEAGLPIETARALHDASVQRMAIEAEAVREVLGSPQGSAGPLRSVGGLTPAEWAGLETSGRSRRGR